MSYFIYFHFVYFFLIYRHLKIFLFCYYLISIALSIRFCMFLRYLTYTEWTTLYGGKKPGLPSSEDVSFRRLPYDHCCLSFQPFKSPYCDKNGNVFELQAVLEFIKKFKINPVTGQVCFFIFFQSDY